MSIKRTIITTLVALTLVAVVVPVVNAQSTSVSALMAQINALQAQLNGLSGTSTSTPAVTTGACAGITFTRNLTTGSKGSDVKCLQSVLNASAATQVATTGAGSPGNETTTFGPATLKAVKKYQTANGLTPANQVGPMTRAKLNASLVLVGPVNPVNPINPVTPTGAVSAMLASDTPTAGALIGNEAQAGLVNINFTGTGTVTSVTLQRSGISTSDTLTAVYLYDGNTRITSGYSFNTNGTLTMNGLNIAVNGSHEISVKGDVYVTAVNTASSVAVALTGFTANGTTSNASVTGNTMMIVTGTAATAVFNTYNSSSPSPAATTINAGSLNQTLWSQNISISPRAVLLSGMTVKMVGSAPSNSIANAGLYVDGTLAGTATINANSQFVFTASNPVTLSTGSHLLEVRGDVVNGASRNFYISLEQGSDVALKDSQLGIYISATLNSNLTASNINGGQVSIGQGTLTVTQDPSFNNTTSLVGGASNVTMASYKFTSYGEDVKVTSLTFTPTIAGSSSAAASSLSTLTNVGLYINGAQIGSNQTATSGTGSLSFTNLGSQLLVPAGTPVTVSIKGDVIATGGVNYVSGSIKFDIASGIGQGMTSNNTTSSISGSGQSLSVSTSNVTFSAATSFAAPAAAPNSTGVEIGAFTLQTGSAEGVTVNNIAVTFPSGSNTMVTANQLTNLTVKVAGSTVGTPIGQPVLTTNNNFSVNLPVGISSSTEFDIYGDIGSSANGLTVTPSVLVTYRGNTSNQTNYTNSNTPSPGSQTTAGVSSISSTGIKVVSSSSLSAQFVSGNSSTALPIATFNVVADSAKGGAVLQDMTFTTVSGTIASVTVNGKTATITNNTGTVYGVGLTVPSSNSGLNIPVTVQLVGVGSGKAGVSNSPVKLTLSGLTYQNGTTVATVSGLPTASSATAQLALVASVPTISLTSASSTGLAAGTNQQIGTFTIAAGAGGDIAVKQIPVVTSVNGTITIPGSTVELRDASGNVLTGGPSDVAFGSQNFVFGTARTISAGTSETYTVYATTGGSTGNAGTSNVTFQLGDKNSFQWVDVVGNASAIVTGGNIYNYPTGSISKSN